MQAAAASNMKRLFLELGGKSPNVIFSDTEDLQGAAKVSAAGIFRNSGQVCIAGSRLLVERSVLSKFTDAMIAESIRLKIGDPLDMKNDIGAVACEQQLARDMSFASSAAKQRLKTNSRRGGTIDGVYVRNVNVGQVKEAVLKLNMHYATYTNQTGEFIPVIKNIVLENITVKNGGYFGILAKGYEESPITNITLKNVRIEKVDEAFSLEHVKNLKLIDTYINGSLMQSPPDTKD